MALFIITSIHLCMVEAEGDETDVSGTKNAMKNMTGKRGREWAPDRRHEAFCFFSACPVFDRLHTHWHTLTHKTRGNTDIQEHYALKFTYISLQNIDTIT